MMIKNIIYFDPFQNEFKRTLEAESSLEIWATWLESVVDKVNIIYNYSKLHERALKNGLICFIET